MNYTTDFVKSASNSLDSFEGFTQETFDPSQEEYVFEKEDFVDPFEDHFQTRFVEPRADPRSKFQRDINQLYGCMQSLCDNEFEEEFGKVLSKFISKARNLLRIKKKFKQLIKHQSL